MARHTRAIVVLLLASIVAACGIKRYQPPDASYSQAPERVFKETRDQVWSAALATITDLELPISRMESESGFLRSGPLDLNQVGPRFVDCGAIKPARKWIDPVEELSTPNVYRLTVLVREVGGGTGVRVRELAGEGSYEGENFDCVPTGQATEVVFREIEAELRAAQGDTTGPG